MRELIAARRKAIRDAAPCTSCGATKARCVALQGKDPAAPDWLGCCAVGHDMRPCEHVPDGRALSVLLDEVESGTVRTVEEATPKPKPREQGMSWAQYLDQGEVWKPNGRRVVQIADMDAEWRYNAARWLERRADSILTKYGLSEAFAGLPLLGTAGLDAYDRETSQRRDDPLAWLRGTVLHLALVADLPTEPKKLALLTERAAHYSTCPKRAGAGDCTCHLSECAIRDGRPELGCTCRDMSPEWTL